MLEYWNDVKEKKTKILLNPTFHYSNCERSELSSIGCRNSETWHLLSQGMLGFPASLFL